VLVVDDYGDVRDLLARVLEGAGFLVRTAANGLEGLIAAYEMRPAVIVMDVSMPVLDGIEATRLIKAGEATRDARSLRTPAIRRATPVSRRLCSPPCCKNRRRPRSCSRRSSVLPACSLRTCAGRVFSVGAARCFEHQRAWAVHVRLREEILEQVQRRRIQPLQVIEEQCQRVFRPGECIDKRPKYEMEPGLGFAGG
jgi:hypothetical protein